MQMDSLQLSIIQGRFEKIERGHEQLTYLALVKLKVIIIDEVQIKFFFSETFCIQVLGVYR